MFKRGVVKRGIIYSDEGFSVAVKRDRIEYREEGRTMTIAAQMLNPRGFLISKATIEYWDDGSRLENNDRKLQIMENVRRALESVGEAVLLDE